MYGRAGLAYVYFCYGCHWMLNVVAGREGEAQAVLVRAAIPVSGLDAIRGRRAKARRDEDLLSGPGKLAQGLAIDQAHNGVDLLAADAPIRLLPSHQRRQVVPGPRIGIATGKGEDIPWRFVDQELRSWASRA